ncbi:MAG: hypothetical protein Q4Q23_06815 [Methanobacteriaceae archaeon]|nr:hypothetical protein [Methanobacteriaceae archaeon]
MAVSPTIQNITFIIATTLGIINIILLVCLSKVYFNNYKQIKSSFTKGYLIFALFLLLQSIFLTVCSITYNGPSLLFAVNNLLLCIALGFLLKNILQ